jgi:hypothetical protein
MANLFTISMKSGVDTTITSISTSTGATNTFTITGGTFPLGAGSSDITGTYTTINDGYGSQTGTVFMFMIQGSAHIDYFVGGSLEFSGDFGSGFAQIPGPIVTTQDLIFNIYNIVEPTPTPTNTPTVTNTPTQTGTAAATPTPSVTNTQTGSPTPTPTHT